MNRVIQETYIQNYPKDLFLHHGLFQEHILEKNRELLSSEVLFEGDLGISLNVGDYFMFEDGRKEKICSKIVGFDGLNIYNIKEKLISNKEEYYLAREYRLEHNRNFPQIPTEVASKKARDDYKKEFGIKEKIKRWFKKGVKK